MLAIYFSFKECSKMIKSVVTYTKDHANREDDAVGKHLYQDVNP